MSVANPIKKVLATRDLTLNMGGVEYDVLLIPRDRMVDIDYSECPENHPIVQAALESVRAACRRSE